MRDEYCPKTGFRFWYDAEGKLLLVCRPGDMMQLVFCTQPDWRANVVNK